MNRCTLCGHAPHIGVCYNMASDNDCSCVNVSFERQLNQLQDEYVELERQQNFPAHQHVWKITEIGNIPVAVTCQICDQSSQVTTDSSGPMVIGQTGVIHEIHMNQTGRPGGEPAFRMQLDSINMESRGGDITMVVNFRSLALPF